MANVQTWELAGDYSCCLIMNIFPCRRKYSFLKKCKKKYLKLKLFLSNSSFFNIFFPVTTILFLVLLLLLYFEVSICTFGSVEPCHLSNISCDHTKKKKKSFEVELVMFYGLTHVLSKKQV